MIGRRRALAVLGVGVAGSQAGHLLTFQLLFGSAAQHLQSSGAHAYFPLLAKTALGAIAAAFLAGIFVIGLARVLSGRLCVTTSPQQPFVELVAALFTVQLACFITQELGEAMYAGTGATSAPHLLLWGTVGQLPVAAVAAIALRWLWTRFESAVDDLRGLIKGGSGPRAPVVVAAPLWPTPAGALLLFQVAGGSLGKRGPPTSLRLSS